HGAEGGDVQARDTGVVGVSGASAATFGEEHHRQIAFAGEFQHAIGLGVTAHALGAGEHGVVIGQHDRARLLVSESGGVDGGDAGDEPVGGCVRDEVFGAAPAGLGGDGQAAVFDEAVGVDQVGNVLAGGTAAE